MKRTNIWLTVLAVLTGTVSAWAGEPGQKQGYKNSIGYTSRVGDLSDIEPGYEDPVRQASCNDRKTPARGKQAFASHCDTACDEMYDAGCDSMLGGSGGGCLSGLFGGGSGTKRPGAWGRIETLLWWAEDRDSPALISTAPNFNAVPFIPGGGSILFGGEDGIDTGMMVGNRVDFGTYFGPEDSFGIGGRVYGLWNGSTSTSVASDGIGPAVGVPFFDVADPPGTGVAVGAFGVLPIGQNLGGGQVVTGAVAANSELDFIGSEVYGRALMTRNKDFRVDMIGGYTFHSLDDSVSLRGRSVFNTTVGGVLTPQNIYEFQDSFTAENTFHGGQFGFETQVVKGRFMFSSLTKVHLGNMRQHVRIAGRSRFDNLPGVAESNTRGLLVQGNDGVYERNQFTFAPEANVKLGYRLTECATFNVGYSLLMWSDVALAGNHIDNRIDSERTLGNLNVPLRTDVPNFAFNTDSFFMHGLDLGVTFLY